jgi:hypothetical protein
VHFLLRRFTCKVFFTYFFKLQTKAEIATPPMISPAAASVTSTQYPESLASLPRGMAEQATKMENPEDIKVIHFGVV